MSAEEARRILSAHLPGREAARLAPLGEGEDHAAWAVDDDLVVRIGAGTADGGPSATRAEASLLAAVARRSPLAVPAPVLVLPDEACLVYPLIPGVPALALAPEERRRIALRSAPLLGAFLTSLHALDPGDVPDVATDDAPAEDYREEAAGTLEAVGDALPAALRPAVGAFVAEPAPGPSGVAAVCHADLGAEHLLVDPVAGVPTGVIDWGDAAVTDPARDLARLLRDLGPQVLDAVLSGYSGPDPDGAALRDRALFFARCAALEDLAYGLATGREVYVRNAEEAIGLLFGADAADH